MGDERLMNFKLSSMEYRSGAFKEEFLFWS
jgi:hypothetical protein